MTLEGRPRPLDRQRAVVLPSLILLSLVLITLSAVLLTSGTSSLRSATRSQHYEQAYQAAEAGLVHAAETFTKLGAPDDFDQFKGELAASGSSYVVTVTKNPDPEKDLITPEGVTVPPRTSYFLSTGIASDKTECKVGALFTLGAGSFRAGVLANNIIASNSSFAAYNSLTSTAPTPLLSGKGILTSNGSLVAGQPQFSLDKSSVEGMVYAAKGTSPSVQVRKLNGSTTEDDRALDKDIEIPEIKVPKLERGKSGAADDDDGGEPDENIPWTTFHDWASAQYTVGSGWKFKHRASDPVISIGQKSGNLTVKYHSETHVQLSHGGPSQIVPLPTAPYPSVVDPGILKSGAYGNVTINADDNFLEEGGVFVMKNLEITAGGKLTLDKDIPTTIYVTERLTVTGDDAIANTSAKPPNLKIYYVGDKDVNLEGGAHAYFTLVAPKANINLIGPTPATPAPVPEVTPAPGVDPTPGADPSPGVGATPGVDPTPGMEPPPAPDPITTTTTFHGALVGKVVTVRNAKFYFDIATDGIGEGVDNNTFSLISRHRL